MYPRLQDLPEIFADSVLSCCIISLVILFEANMIPATLASNSVTGYEKQGHSIEHQLLLLLNMYLFI